MESIPIPEAILFVKNVTATVRHTLSSKYYQAMSPPLFSLHVIAVEIGGCSELTGGNAYI